MVDIYYVKAFTSGEGMDLSLDERVPRARIDDSADLDDSDKFIVQRYTSDGRRLIPLDVTLFKKSEKTDRPFLNRSGDWCYIDSETSSLD